MRALLAFVLFAPAASLAAPLDAALQQMVTARGEDYLFARDEALALPGASADIRARAEALNKPGAITERNWRHAAMTLVLAAHLDGENERLTHLRGLDPAEYLQARLPVPAVAREIESSRIAVGAQLEVLLKTRDRFPFADDSAYPAERQADLAELRAAEEEALLVGLLTGVARSGHPVSFFALRSALDDTSLGRARLQAAVMLGTTDPAAATTPLAALLADDTKDPALRAAAAVGLGKVRSEASLQALKAGAGDAEADVRFSSLRALGNLGSSFVHRAHPTTTSERLRQAASDFLVGRLASASDEREANAIIDSLATIAHPSAVAGLASLVDGAPAGSAARATFERAHRRVERTVTRSSR